MRNYKWNYTEEVMTKVDAMHKAGFHWETIAAKVDIPMAALRSHYYMWTGRKVYDPEKRKQYAENAKRRKKNAKT